MKKANYLKMFFLLWGIIVGIGNVCAANDDYDYEWVETSFSDLQTGSVVVLVDEHLGNIALPNNESSNFEGVPVDVQGTKLSGTVSDNIQWKIRKNDDGTVTFLDGNSPLLVTSGGELKVGGNGIYNFTYNDGKLSCTVNNTTYYLYWWLAGSAGGDKYWAMPTENNNDPNLARFTFYKKVPKNYVKWKRVDGLYGTSSNLKVPLKNNDIVVVVDLKTGKAMSNDKGEKDPVGVAVTLNYDKDRIIMDEVPENVQWRYQYNSGNTFVTTNETPQQLYTDADKGLKVGNITEATNPISTFVFTTKNGAYFPVFEIEETDYQPNFDDGMFSNSWTLEKVADYDGEGIAIFKKVEDPQKVAKIEMAEYYSVFCDVINYLDLNASITGADFSEINWTSSKPGVATAATVTDEETNRTYGKVTGYQRGSTVITASVPETDYHDKASTKCTVIVDEMAANNPVPGSISNPFTVAQAKQLIESENKTITIDGQTVTWQEGVRYYIKGKVSKVNSGMMAMFGDMDFGEMMGNMGGGTGTGGGGTSSFNFEDSMDDMDFDMEDMEESGFDMSSMGFDMSSLGFDLSAMFGTSDKVTYYISDDGVKDKEKQLKVINGCGTPDEPTGTMVFNPIPKLSPGDCVVVCGPLVYTEDTNMFSSMMGGNNNEEPKMSGKVDEMNYLAEYDPTLLITRPEPKEIYVNNSLKLENEEGVNEIYSIDNLFDRFNETKITDLNQIKEVTCKSSDEDIAKWDDEKKELVGVNEGKAKITVKVKVVLQDKTDDQDEKSYTMKRKFKVIVKTRDLDPAGYYDGEWKLTTSTDDLEDGTRLVLVGTRVKVDKENNNNKEYTDYMMVENNAMMGGGKNGSKIEFDDADTGKTKIKSETVINKKGLEVVLEKADENGTSWYLNVGTDENDTPLYLYASDTSEDKEEGEGDGQGDGQGDNKFDFSKIMEMFMSSSGLKVGTMAAATADSCKATIAFNGSIATISFPKTQGKNNTIMLGSSFDMEEMMNMFGGMGNKEEENEQDEQGGGESSNTDEFDMSSFDMFMAAFNTKKANEADNEKVFMPRIYRFVPDASYKTAISSAEWKTIVSYKDVKVPEDVDAYVVKKVVDGEENSKALLTKIEDKKLKGGEPYLLHSTNGSGDFTLTLVTPEEEAPSAPKKNLLLVSNKLISSESSNTPIYVLSKKSKGVGFYKWTGGDLGSGRVYLPHAASLGTTANEYCGFFVDETTAIESVEDAKTNVGPFYDLQGRRVEQPTKGVYVVNGKKVIIK